MFNCEISCPEYSRIGWVPAELGFHLKMELDLQMDELHNYQGKNLEREGSPCFRNFELVDQHGGYHEKMCLIYEDFPSKLAFFFLISFFDQRNTPWPYTPHTSGERYPGFLIE